MQRNKGYCISLEGGEGSGKSTVIRAITDHLTRLGHEVVVTREPGGVPVAEAIRSIILNREYTEMDARTEALLFAAARRQHFVQKMKPALERGAVVVLDRFVDSSLAYQGYARGIGVDEVERMNDFAIEGFRPDLTLLLDLAPEVGLERIARDPEREVNKLDRENAAFHMRVREGYRRIAARFPERCVIVDAEAPIVDVVARCLELVELRLAPGSV